MKNKKGFTLVELLGVIVIIVLLILLVSPIFVNYIKDSKKDAYNTQINTIKESARNWAASKDNIALLPKSENECIEITLGKLKEEGYLDFNITNPETNELFNDDIKVVIKKKNNELVYELNETDQSVCSAILTSEYPGWVYVSADKVKVTKNDIVKLTITSDKKIKNYNLAKENVTVKVGSEIQEEDTVKEINCTNGNKLVCEIKIEGLKGTGNINVGISKETLIDEDGNKSRGTVLNTNVEVDNNGPTIKYISKSSTNKDDKYSTAADTVTIKVKVEDEDELVGEIEENEIKVYVEGIETSATKEVSKDELEYTIKIKNITGNGVLTLKILADSIADELGNTNKEKIISPGIKIDNIKPTIEYSQEGSEEILSKIAVTIKANDNETGIDNESLKYIYGTNENALVVNTYANESEVTLENQTGEYYLIAEACDNAGNCTKKVSNKFKISNSGPEITISPASNSNYEKRTNIKIKVQSTTEIDDGTLLYGIGTNKEEIEPIMMYQNDETIQIGDITGEYYIKAQACDMLGNCAEKDAGIYYLDSTMPTITFETNGNSSYVKSASTKLIVEDNVGINSAKYILTTNKAEEPNIDFQTGATVNLSNITGIYYIIVKTCDTSENCTMAISNPFYIDNTAPTAPTTMGMVFGDWSVYNGSWTKNNVYFATSESSKGPSGATDSHSGVAKYQISKDNSTWVDYNYNNSDSMYAVSETSTRYFRAVDNAGNAGPSISRKANIDKTVPTVTASVSGKVATFTLGDNVGLSGYTVTTSTATPSSWTAISGTSSKPTWTASQAGTYYVHVKDTSGNTKYASFSIAQTAFCAYNAGQTWTYNYTGGMQSFTTPCAGTYKLEVWGAQGGGVYTNGQPINGYRRYDDYDGGGAGGYASGNKTLTKNQVLYIGVGGKPNANSYTESAIIINEGGFNGGGKTINANSYSEIGSAAAGAGGGGTHIGLSNATIQNTNKSNLIIVAGGGGGCAIAYANYANGGGSYRHAGGVGGGTTGGNGLAAVSNYGQNYGRGGTQTAGGSGSPNGGYGYGGAVTTVWYGAGGGGGYYGGGAGQTYNGPCSGGGGSGYIGGVTGGSMQSGVRSGHGMARITLVSITQ